MNKTAILIVIATLSVGLGGCTSLRGAPERYLSQSDAKEFLFPQYSLPTVLQKFQTPGLNRKAYRNEVIQAYIFAYNAQYTDFRDDLSEEKRATEIGFDTALIGVNGLATLVESSASDLAVLSQALVGTRGSIDTNFYAEKTLPALFAAMDAERLRVRSLITSKLDDSIEDYPLSEALADLQAYQDAGSLNLAIAKITNSAVSDRANAEEIYAKVSYRCDPTAELVNRTRPIGNYNRAVFRAALAEAEQDRDSDDAELVPQTARNKLVQLGTIYSIEQSLGVTLSVRQVQALILEISNAFSGDTSSGGGFCKTEEIEALENRLQEFDSAFQAGG